METGLLLVLAPWSRLWDHNYFGQLVPWLGACMSLPFVRGAVSGVGLITVVAGLRDLAGAFSARHRAALPGGPDSAA